MGYVAKKGNNNAQRPFNGLCLWASRNRCNASAEEQFKLMQQQLMTLKMFQRNASITVWENLLLSED